jgi:predicted transcriptional regulator
MSPSPVAISPDADLEDCMREMEAHQLHRILVVDAQGACCGIVALADVALHSGEKDAGEVVEELSRPVGNR